MAVPQFRRRAQQNAVYWGLKLIYWLLEFFRLFRVAAHGFQIGDSLNLFCFRISRHYARMDRELTAVRKFFRPRLGGI